MSISSRFATLSARGLCKELLGIALLAAAVSGAGAATRERWTGEVSHVSDGDTLWVRPTSHREAQSVRIDGIDAPEICQAFGPQSSEALAHRVLGRRVQVTVHGHDTYGRALARVTLAGEDVGAWMVREGYAWSYRYRGRKGPYARAETAARDRQLGLFAEKNPMQPREFRRRHGSCHADGARP